jgi:sphingomyelin phosphodiesterase
MKESTSSSSALQNNTVDPLPVPDPASSSLIVKSALQQLANIAASPFYAGNTCGACMASLQVAKFVVLANPKVGPELAVAACNQFQYSKTCEASYGSRGLGAVITQVVANADVGGYDGQMLCQNFLSLCPLPAPSPLNLTSWFAKPKPNPLPAPKKPSGVRLPVLHMSDVHLDPRYATGAEANCTGGLCCRTNNPASTSPNQTIFPAPRFGTYKWSVCSNKRQCITTDDHCLVTRPMHSSFPLWRLSRSSLGRPRQALRGPSIRP